MWWDFSFMLFLNISPSPLKRRLTNDNDDHHHHFPLPFCSQFCYRIFLILQTHTHTRIWITPGKKSRKFKVKRLEHDGTKHDYPDDNNDDILVITIIIKWIECSGTKIHSIVWLIFLLLNQSLLCVLVSENFIIYFHND